MNNNNQPVNVPPQPVYGPGVQVTPTPMYAPPMEDTTPLSPWAYIGYQLLFSIPLIGLIMLFVYAFGQGNVNRRNFARSYLILMAIVIVLAIIFGVVFGAVFNNLIKKSF